MAMAAPAARSAFRCLAVYFLEVSKVIHPHRLKGERVVRNICRAKMGPQGKGGKTVPCSDLHGVNG